MTIQERNDIEQKATVFYKTSFTHTFTLDTQRTQLLKTFNDDTHLVCRRRSSLSSSCGISLQQQNNNKNCKFTLFTHYFATEWEFACKCARICLRTCARLHAWVVGLLVRIQIIRWLASATNQSELELKKIQKRGKWHVMSHNTTDFTNVIDRNSSIVPIG